MRIRHLLGRKYEELDCWDLFREAARWIFNIEVPEFQDPKELIGDWTEVGIAEPGDAVVMGRNTPSHIGIAVMNGGDIMVLHTTRNFGSCMHRMGDISMFNMKVLKIYRHRSRI